MSTKADKIWLRQSLREKTNSLPDEYMKTANAEIFKNLISTDEYKNAAVVFTYYSVRREPDTTALIRRAVSDGKRAALPVASGGGAMYFAEIKSLDGLVPDNFGIPAPDRFCERLVPRPGDIIIVPALCFDAQGYRLGHGGGYYDRYLDSNPAFSIGLCFELLLKSRLPREGHDRRVCALITEKKILRPHLGPRDK